MGAACACGVVEKPPKKGKTKVGEAKRVTVFWLFISFFNLNFCLLSTFMAELSTRSTTKVCPFLSFLTNLVFCFYFSLLCTLSQHTFLSLVFKPQKIFYINFVINNLTSSLTLFKLFYFIFIISSLVWFGSIIIWLICDLCADVTHRRELDITKFCISNISIIVYNNFNTLWFNMFIVKLMFMISHVPSLTYNIS